MKRFIRNHRKLCGDLCVVRGKAHSYSGQRRKLEDNGKIAREIPEIKIQLSAKIRTIDLAEKAINLGLKGLLSGCRQEI